MSIQDRIALAIARNRKIVLLTGDKALRTAAMLEGVPIMGTLGVLDQLFKGNYISDAEYESCLKELEKHNGGEVRLPHGEIKRRLERIRCQRGNGTL